MISICIPAYNYAHYLSFAIESCLNQDEDFELIVLDNCSTDDTPLLRDIYSHDKRVKWARNEALIPVQQNWNMAVSMAAMSHVKLLQADDFLKPGSIGQLKTMVRDYPHVQLHGHLSDWVDESGVVIGSQRPYSNVAGIAGIFQDGNTALKGKLRQTVRFKEPTSNLFSKAAWESVGGYSSDYRWVFDIHFNTKLMHRYPSALWNLSLANVRRHAQSDGAKLPYELNLLETSLFVNQIYEKLGTNLSSMDRAAGNAILMYKLLNNGLVRKIKNPTEAVRYMYDNANLFSINPAAWFYLLRILKNRILFGDVQQRLPR